MDRNYQDLALKQERVDSYIDLYFKSHSKYAVRDDKSTSSKRTIKFGHPGAEDAMVVLHFKNTGLTTIQFKVGKNHALGQSLADHFHNTVDLSENVTINLSLKGIDLDNVSVLMDELSTLKSASGDTELQIEKNDINKYSTRYRIVSKNYKDQVVITHHHTSNNLQVQGKPLFCYRNISYFLSMLLDQQSLYSVINKTNDEDKQLIREDVATTHIQNEYKVSYPHMDAIFKDLLVSSYCVKLAAPNLPEYSMLLYADLRVLEGVIKKVLADNGKPTDSIKVDIGSYFNCMQSTANLKEEHQDAFGDPSIVTALEGCYQLYRRQRHSLFHMSDFAMASRKITSLGEVMNLSSDIASNIEELYKSCN